MRHPLTARRRAARAALVAVAALLAGALPTGVPLAAQESLPVIRLSQMPGANSVGFGGIGSARLDRDAFLVVLEIGADSRARIIHPVSPREAGFVSAGRSVRMPLPSADAAFIRTAELRIPEIVAFASDVAPDLSAFTQGGRRWDFQYEVPWGASLGETVRDLAVLLYGSVDLPFSVETRRVFPQLSASAIGTLSSCGYQMNAAYSPRFNSFLWQAFGPVTLPEAAWIIEQRYRNVQWEGPLWYMAGMLPQSFFARSVGLDLWNTFGAGCAPLHSRFPHVLLAQGTPANRAPAGGDASPDITIPVPPDRVPDAAPPVVPGVTIVPATAGDMVRRSDAVTRVAGERAGIRQDGVRQGGTRATDVRGPLTREANYDLVKRQEIATVMAYLTAQRMAGQSGSVIDAFERVRAGRVLANGTEVGGNRRGPAFRASTYDDLRGGRTTGGSGGSGGVGASGTSSSGGAVGSGSMSGGSTSRGGEARGGGGGRGSGTGRP